MNYKKFSIKNYRAITKELVINLTRRIIPLVGINECGKTTILQAIFCFDFTNDNSNEGRHLKNIENLYSTSKNGNFTITADIECQKDEVVQTIKNYEPPEPEYDLFSEFIKSNNQINEMQITRTIQGESRVYFSPLFGVFSAETNNKLCEEIVRDMPYILYNDDFTDRPTSEIDLSQPTSDWYAIFQRVFKSANKDYTLDTLAEIDERWRDSILDDVEMYLSQALTEAWVKFTPSKDTITLKLKFKTGNKLQISIKEQNKGQPANYFFVTDRSKGFIWYYNFIMKIRFNPKFTGTPNSTIFLLDEPGSYLHEAAQTSLCEKLKNISQQQGVIIYCTHSPKLLNPSYIPVNNILITEKQKQGTTTWIKTTPLMTKNDTESRKDTAMQPIYEALLLPEYQAIQPTEKILLVEGIFDMYAIKIFCELDEMIRVLPCTGAISIINNISYCIAYQKEYVALWDNDKEGRKAKQKAIQDFGLYEAEKFLLLTDISDTSGVRMEEMIDSLDYIAINKILGLAENATYEQLILATFFLDKDRQKAILKKISPTTIRNFKVLQSRVNKILMRTNDPI